MRRPDKTTILIIKACVILALAAIVWLHSDSKCDTEAAALTAKSKAVA